MINWTKEELVDVLSEATTFSKEFLRTRTKDQLEDKVLRLQLINRYDMKLRK